jgi:hypothetical protein
VERVLRVRVEKYAFVVDNNDEVIRVEVVIVPPVALEKNSVPTIIVDACNVILDRVLLDIAPVDRVDTSIIGADNDVRKIACPVMVEKVSVIVESVVMTAFDVVKEVPDTVENVPFVVYNEEAVTC